MTIMTKTFSNYLWNNKRKNNSVITHTRIGNKDKNIHGGSYTIHDDDKDFYDMYYQKVFVRGKKEYLTEMQIPDGQILIDLDFRFSPDVKRRKVNDNNVEEITLAYTDIIKNMYEIPVDTEIPLWVLRKPNVNCLEDKTKDGLHIVIGLSATAKEQLYIREKMIERADDIFYGKPLQNSYDDVFDKGISTKKTNWQMYGSQKPGNERYEIIEYFELSYDGDNFDWHLIEDYDERIVLEKISARNKNIIKVPLKSDIKELLTETKQEEKVDTKKKKERKRNNIALTDKTICYDVAKEKLTCLPIEKLESVTTATGIIYQCASTGDERIFDIVNKAMSRASNYDKQWVKDKWNEYDPVKHKDYHFTYGYLCDVQENLLNRAIRCSCHFDYALAAIHFNYGNVRYYKEDDKLMVWNGHYWTYEDAKKNNAMIGKWCYDTLYKELIKKQIKILKTLPTIIDEKEREKRQTYARKLDEESIKMKTDTYQASIANQIIKIAKNDCLVEQINLADDYFVFKNKTWSLLENKWVKPSSIKNLYNTLYSPHEWREPTEEEIETVQNIISQIQTEDDTRKAMLQIMATGLWGKCIEKFITFIGAGRNGKGLLNSMFLMLLGDDYGGDPVVSVLCEKQKSGGLPELANLGLCRYARFGEPDEACGKLNWGICKGLTGGDPIKARKLHSNKTKYKNNLTLIVERQTSSNLLITGDGTDSASVNRMFMIPFNSHFSEDCSKCKCGAKRNGRCFPINKKYKNQIFQKNHVFALFRILTKHFIEYIETYKLATSKEIDRETKRYLKCCDEFGCWFEDNYTITGNESNYITLKNITEDWQESEEYRGLANSIKRKRGKKYVMDRLKQIVNDDSFGISFKTQYRIPKSKKRIRNVFFGIVSNEQQEDNIQLCC